MTVTFTPARYHTAKLRFLDETADADAAYLRDVNRSFADLIELDTRLQAGYCRGEPFDPAAEAELDTLFRVWHAVAVRATAHAGTGDEADTLRANIDEMAAMLDPAAEVSGPNLEEALADFAAGRTDGGVP
jgi:hypothetical protein